MGTTTCLWVCTLASVNFAIFVGVAIYVQTKYSHPQDKHCVNFTVVRCALGFGVCLSSGL